MLKKSHEILHYTLLDVYNTCWTEGSYPQRWKEEYRIYLPKANKKSHNFAKAYRSITLVSVIGKTYERIGSDRLTAFMEQNGLLSPYQYAYRKNKDLTQALLYYILDAQNSLNEGKTVLTSLVDLEGAYDCVWRAGLLKKLHDAGITGRLFLLIKSYLTGRIANLQLIAIPQMILLQK